MSRKNRREYKNSYSYINQEIKESGQDHIGFNVQRDALDNAIDSGAKMIGLTADFGYGKSSLVGMVSSDRAKYEEPIKINLWDNLQNADPKNPSDKETQLEKSFLFQLANNSGKKTLTKYVNKRLSGNNGLLSFTFRSSKMWIWLIVALLFFALGLAFHLTKLEALDPNMWILGKFKLILKVEIYPICYALSIIFLACGLWKYRAAFSTWKSEGQRKFDSTDVFSIFQEIIDTIRSSKTRIILIEDLDRLSNENSDNNDRTITSFIRILYRLSNMCKNSNICFVVAIEPAKTADKNELYSKFFDYILDLKAVHIDDFTKILKSLLQDKEREIKKLFNATELNEHTAEETKAPLHDNIYSQFEYLIRGQKLTIRELKHRLNDAIVLFKTIQSKRYLNSSGMPNMVTCCVVSYLRSEFEEDYYKFVKNGKELAKAIQAGCLLRIDTTHGRENKIKILNDEISGIYDNENKLSKEFINELSGLLIDGIIDDDYRQYFFSYPNGSYIKNIYERELEDVLLFGKPCDDTRLAQLVEKSFLSKGECKIASECMDRLIQLNKTFPSVLLCNERLLSYCFSKQSEQVIKMLVENYSWANDNSADVVKAIVKINSYGFSQKNELLKRYAETLYGALTLFGSNFLRCRIDLVKKMNGAVIVFKNMFVEAKSPCLSAEEAKSLGDANLIFELLAPNKCTDGLISALATICKKELNDSQKTILTDMMRHLISHETISMELAQQIVTLLTANKIVDDDIFKCVTKHVEGIGRSIELYLEKLDKPIDKAYCECIRGFESGFKLNDNVLRSLYDNEYYLTHLRHCLALNKLSPLLYDVKIFNQRRISELYTKEKDLFLKYRLNLLTQSNETKSTYSFIYGGSYPFLTENEARIISIDDCLQTQILTRLPQNKEKFIEYLPLILHNGEDVYQLMKCLLEKQSALAKDIFEKISFKNAGYSCIDSTKREEIASLYEKFYRFDAVSKLIHFADITGELLPMIEDKIIEKINATSGSRSDMIKAYIELLSKLDIESSKAADLILKYNYLGAMPQKIYGEMRRREKYMQYIVGRTLFEKRFEYDSSITLDEYITVYVEVDEMFDFMSSNHEFLEAVYLERKFDRLSIKQLLIYNSWGQRIELLEAFMNKCEDTNRRKDYLLKIERIDSLEDSDQIRLFLCSRQFDDLLVDDDLVTHIRRLFWKEHPWEKAVFQRYINKLAG